MKNLSSQLLAYASSFCFRETLNRFRALALSSAVALLLSFSANSVAQDGASSAASATSATTTAASVPHLVRFSGAAKDLNGNALTGTVGITFLLYSGQDSGSPLWLETQNVQTNASGRYTVQLGATKPDGVPVDLFTSGEARWLGVQISGQAEQSRVLLLSVPYALKAGDAETVGGLPASAFMLANGAPTSAANNTAVQPAASSAAKNSAPPANPAVTGKGVVDYIPMWDTTSDIIDSVIFQKTSEIGINTITPAATLDVNGKTDIRDTLTLYPKSTDSTLAINGTAFKVAPTGKVTFITGQTFPGAGTITGITTATGSGLSGGGTTGTLNLNVPSAGITNTMLANSNITLNASTAGGLTTPGAMTLGDTYTIGLKTCSTNQILQYNGTSWACAALSSGTGTVTSVGSGPGLTGGPITTSGTLSIATAGVSNSMLQNSAVTVTAGTGLTGGGSVALGSSTTVSVNPAVVPELAAANTFTNDQIINVSDGNYAFTVNNTGTGEGAYVAGIVVGAFAEASSSETGSVGLLGIQTSATGETFGVYGVGQSTVGTGVYGVGYYKSNTGQSFGGYLTIGTWGDNGVTGAIGSLATADSGYALAAANNDPDYVTTVLENDELGNNSAGVFETYSQNYGGSCYIDVSGNLSCNGSVNAVVPVTGSRQVAMNTISSPEHWFEDIGSAQLANGTGVVNIESVFGETVNTGVDYHVFLTPNGDCKGLYVAHKSATSFEVRELGGGTASIGFDYRIVAKRKGYEQLRLVDETKQMNAPRPKRAPGQHPAMVNPSDLLKAHQRQMHIAQLTKSAVPAK
jgi:hypothetical protein